MAAWAAVAAATARGGHRNAEEDEMGERKQDEFVVTTCQIAGRERKKDMTRRES